MKARDIMETGVITVTPDMSLHEAGTILSRNRISGAPVVDEELKLIGVISSPD